jgi:arginyl-tRNA synthetase
MTRRDLHGLLVALWRERASEEPDFAVTRAPDISFGEFTSNFALKLAPRLRQSPDYIGRAVTQRLATQWPGRVEVSGGRLNFFMSDDMMRGALEQAVREGTHYGSGDTLAGKRVLVEYVSADPNGPLSFAAGRHAAFGEALCRLLENQGARVTREFYLNDATTSSKVRLLGESVAAWVCEAFGQTAVHPEGTLDDAFVRGVAAELARREGHRLLKLSAPERLEICSQAALEAAVASQRTTLERFGVRFDDWVSESSLRREGRVEAVLARLEESGYADVREGALWLQTAKFGDEADRVLRRSNGNVTYLAGDIAYHAWKAERGFDSIINVWSAEHRPYVDRTRAALRAADCPVEKFEFLICEGATLKRDGVPLRLSSGGGPLALEEELGQVDADTLKFMFVLRDANKSADVDLEIARRDDENNRAYAARLLPARLGRLLRETEARLQPGDTATEWAPGELALARQVALWPDEAAEAAARREPARVARFVLEMAGTVRELVKVSPPGAATPERVQLLRAAYTVAGNALRLLGLEARDRF